jgi:hypothetical protein
MEWLKQIITSAARGAAPWLEKLGGAASAVTCIAATISPAVNLLRLNPHMVVTPDFG